MLLESGRIGSKTWPCHMGIPRILAGREDTRQRVTVFPPMFSTHISENIPEVKQAVRVLQVMPRCDLASY